MVYMFDECLLLLVAIPPQHTVRVEDITCQIKQRPKCKFLGSHSSTNEMPVILGHEATIT
jgi:hypothetical protein